MDPSTDQQQPATCQFAMRLFKTGMLKSVRFVIIIKACMNYSYGILPQILRKSHIFDDGIYIYIYIYIRVNINYKHED